MKFQNLKQLAKGINGVSDGAIRCHALAELERAKWRFWNGQTVRGLIGLVHLGQWARARCFEHIPALGKMGRMLLDTIRYLEFNADSMPNYGKRYRGHLRISTGFAESAVNEIIAKRMSKRQQMRWNRYTVVFSKSAFTFSMARWKPLAPRLSPTCSVNPVRCFGVTAPHFCMLSSWYPQFRAESKAA
jgi:hypothetical protein